MRQAAVVEGTRLANVIVLPDGAEGDALLSATCVEITDLDPKPGLETGWTFVDGAFVPPAVAPVTYAQVEALRRARYQVESDGLFFGAQRDGGDLVAWEAAVAGIKADLPYPVV